MILDHSSELLAPEQRFVDFAAEAGNILARLIGLEADFGLGFVLSELCCCALL